MRMIIIAIMMMIIKRKMIKKMRRRRRFMRMIMVTIMEYKSKFKKNNIQIIAIMTNKMMIIMKITI